MADRMEPVARVERVKNATDFRLTWLVPPGPDGTLLHTAAQLTAAVEAEHARAQRVVSMLVAHIERQHKVDQHNPYTARELWPDVFATADEYTGSHQPAATEGEKR